MVLVPRGLAVTGNQKSLPQGVDLGRKTETFHARNYSGLGPNFSLSSRTPQLYPKVCPVLRSI